MPFIQFTGKNALDESAGSLLQADKVPLQRMRTLECSVPYALEGLLRRMIDGAGVQLLQVQLEMSYRLIGGLRDMNLARYV